MTQTIVVKAVMMLWKAWTPSLADRGTAAKANNERIKPQFQQ